MLSQLLKRPLFFTQDRGGREEKAYAGMEDAPLGLFCEEYQGKAAIE